MTRDGVLVIEGERKQEEEKEEHGFKRYERVFGQFVRRFRLVRANFYLASAGYDPRAAIGSCPDASSRTHRLAPAAVALCLRPATSRCIA